MVLPDTMVLWEHQVGMGGEVTMHHVPVLYFSLLTHTHEEV